MSTSPGGSASGRGGTGGLPIGTIYDQPTSSRNIPSTHSSPLSSLQPLTASPPSTNPIRTPSPPVDTIPHPEAMDDGTPRLDFASPSRIKAFPHNADLLGSASEAVGGRSRHHRLTQTPNQADPTSAEEVQPLADVPPPRRRRRIAPQHGGGRSNSDGTLRPTPLDPPHLAAFERNSFRGEGIHELGMMTGRRHTPTAFRPRSDPDQPLFTTPTTDDESRPVVTTPRFVPQPLPSTRRAPNDPETVPRHRPLSELLNAYGLTGEGLAESEVASDHATTSDATVPPPRPRATTPRPAHHDDGPINFSPDRNRTEQHAPPPAMARAMSIGTAFRSRRHQERLARLDELRNASGGGPEMYGTLFGGPSALGPVDRRVDPFSLLSSLLPPQAEAMDVDESSESNRLGEIGRWNQNVQDALARRVSAERPRSPSSLRRLRDGLAPYSRNREASPLVSDQPGPSQRIPETDFPYSSLWGEIPIDTATTGLHDIYRPRSVTPIPFLAALQENHRRIRLPRAFQEPEQRPGQEPTLPSHPLATSSHARGTRLTDAFLGWPGPDTAQNSQQRPRINYLAMHGQSVGGAGPSDGDWQDRPGEYNMTLLGARRNPQLQRRQSDEETTSSVSAVESLTARPPRWEAPYIHGSWASAYEEMIPAALREPPAVHPWMYHPPCLQLMNFSMDMPEEDKVLLARVVTKTLKRWPMEVRRKAAEDVVETVEWGKIGEREGMNRDHNCSICHDEYQEETPTAITPCKHMYHRSCLDTWLQTPNTSTCPMCRRDLAVLTVMRKMVANDKAKSRASETPTQEEGGDEAVKIWMSV